MANIGISVLGDVSRENVDLGEKAGRQGFHFFFSLSSKQRAKRGVLLSNLAGRQDQIR